MARSVLAAADRMDRVPIVGVLCSVLAVAFGGCGVPAVTGLVLGLVSLVPAVIIVVAVATA